MNWFRDQAITLALGLTFGGVLIGACWIAGALSDLIIG